MGAAYRDYRTGEYRYDGYDNYEQRRLRDYDDRASGRSPFAPAPGPPPAPAPFTWSPPPAAPTQQAPTAPAPVSAATLVTPQSFTPEFLEDVLRLNAPQEPVPITPVITWPTEPVPQNAVAVALQDLQAQIDAARLLPAQVSQVPEFDAAFDAQVDAGRAVPFVQNPEFEAMVVDQARLDRIVQQAGPF